MIKQGRRLAFSESRSRKTENCREVKVFPRSSEHDGNVGGGKGGSNPLAFQSITVNNRQGSDHRSLIMDSVNARPERMLSRSTSNARRPPSRRASSNAPRQRFAMVFKATMPCCSGISDAVGAGLRPVASQAPKREPSPNIGRSGRQAYGICTRLAGVKHAALAVDFKRAVELTVLTGIPSSSRRKPFSRSGAAPSTPTPPRAPVPGHAAASHRLLFLCPSILGDWEEPDLIAKVHAALHAAPETLLARSAFGHLPGTPPRPGHPHRRHGPRGRAPVLPPRSPRACAGRRRTHHLQQREHQRQSAVVSVNQLDEELIASVMGILDEPPVPAGGLPSTLVERMEDGRLRLLRAGAVTSAQIAEAGFEVVEEE